MPPADVISALVERYLARHPAEARVLAPLVSQVRGDRGADPLSRRTRPAMSPRARSW